MSLSDHASMLVTDNSQCSSLTASFSSDAYGHSACCDDISCDQTDHPIPASVFNSTDKFIVMLALASVILLGIIITISRLRTQEEILN